MIRNASILVCSFGLASANFVVASPTTSLAVATATPTPTPTISVSPAESPKIDSAVPHDQPNLSDVEIKSLKNEFARAWKQAEKAFDHQMNTGLKEHRASQKIQQKDWRSKEKAERKAYFEKHHKGPEKREYVLNYIKRKKEFEEELAKDLVRIRGEWKIRRKAFEDRAKEAKKSFDDSIQQKQKPAEDVWPKG